jgi:hypothetical protein
MIVEKYMECRLTGETQALGENLPRVTFVHHKIPHDHINSIDPREDISGSYFASTSHLLNC